RYFKYRAAIPVCDYWHSCDVCRAKAAALCIATVGPDPVVCGHLLDVRHSDALSHSDRTLLHDSKRLWLKNGVVYDGGTVRVWRISSQGPARHPQTSTTIPSTLTTPGIHFCLRS